MPDSDDENYVTFGSPLDPLDEENVPRKKPITIEEQYAYDAQGRRRFHGAFTGGFSAGYFNTVGTRDGWRPQQFKSSRSSKAASVTQCPEDFMDDEDTSQFGIAPKGIRATSDYTDHGQRGVKRDRVNHSSDGPIPGVPVLKELLKPVRETIGITLLKKMGWKPGQGVGSRITKKEKAKIKRRNEKIKVSQQLGKAIPASSSEESEDESGDVTFAPDDYEPFRCNPKDNFFGIGYSGLDRRNILSGHVSLFEAPAFKVQDKNKKLSIHGQAFGVGAFEADDEDIYEREDMSRYDFSLGPERKTKSRWSDDSSSKSTENNCVDGFVSAKSKLQRKKIFRPPELPKDFIPVHTVRKSRFYPPIENVPRTLENGKRKDLTAVDRARILEDNQNYKKPLDAQPNAIPSVASNIVSRTLNLHGKQQVEERKKFEIEQSKSAASWMEKLNVRSFIKGGTVGSCAESMGSLKKLDEFKDDSAISDKPQMNTDDDKTKESSSTKNSAIIPFLSDPDKQRRFEQYLDLLKKGEKSKFESIQPLSMTEWDREHERSEFEQAARLFEQKSDYVVNKFTHASSSDADLASTSNSQEDELKQAVKMKMFGKLTRERMEWKPASIVCKRFNIPEPKIGCAKPEMQKTAAKFSIFDSLDWSNSTKFLKATDTVTNETIQPLSVPLSKENAMNSLNSESKSINETYEDVPASECVSEKMRNFEASYEKVFGKEVQTTPVKSSNASQNLRDVEEEEVGTETEPQSSEKTKEDAVARTVTKSKSEAKKDLFKAIFLSSSEDSDSELEENVDSEALKSVLIGKVPSEVNAIRNTSPPRGIFAKIDLDNLIVKPKTTENTEEGITEAKDGNVVSESESQKITPEENQDHADSNVPDPSISSAMYGPALPARLMKNENSSTSEASSSQTMKPVFRSVVVPKVTTDSKISGKWIERGKVKKSKKEKKKHKHKEHKSSKHKRKSKKERRDS